ncbi:MAG: xanthine dehydrogenase molybdopterin binding subunit [Rhodothermia bacterium]|nr:MAG: xanthine dehydrogenase molybdopterin binding subunit [Rhodothermia bacterium]
MHNIDAAHHTRGTAEFVDDVNRPEGMLFAAVCASGFSHGRIVSMDVTAACSASGVKAVLTADDIPGTNQLGTIIQDEPLLAEEAVHYIGQPLAIVVATSSRLARSAASLIQLDVGELPVITDPREAFAKGQVIGPTRTFEMGDIDARWVECDVVVHGECDIGGQEHVYLETHRARAVPVEGRRMRISSSTQSPYAGQKHVAKILGIQNHDVEVDVKRLGGGFGGKEDQATHWACIAALGAWHTGKAVELVLRREEDMRMTGKRHPYVVDFKIGATSEGKILAYEAKHYQNAGAVADLSPAVLERTLFHATNSYFIPNVRVFAASCRTNLPPNTAFRGFGGPQGMFVIESAITKLAAELGLDRRVVQEKNLLSEGDLFPYGQKIQNSRARQTWEHADSIYDVDGIESEIAEFNEANFITKKGMAMMPICFGISFTTTPMNQAGALVHVYTDGSVSVSTGGIEMGQGLSTNLAKIVADTFGIRADRVKIESTNTTRVANMSPTAASSSTLLNGNAAVSAVHQILDRLRAVAAQELSAADKDEIEFKEYKIFRNGRETELSWNDLVLKAHLQRVDLSAHGFFATPDIHFNKVEEKGQPFAYHTFGTAILEVTVDCLRGRYTVDSVKIVHDMGRPLNRLVDLGQIEGGLAQGLGWMTMEDLRYDSVGRLMSSALASYKVPDAFFMPDDIQVEFLVDADTDAAEAMGPFGSKAVGEPPLMYGIGVFFAIRHAMTAFRPNADLPFESPITPERVLLGLHPDFRSIEGDADRSTGGTPKPDRGLS